MSTGSRKIMFVRSSARPVRRSCNLTAICEPIVYRQCGNLNIYEPYRPLRPVTGKGLLLLRCFQLGMLQTGYQQREQHSCYLCHFSSQGRRNGKWRIPVTDLETMNRRTGEIVTRLLNILRGATPRRHVHGRRYATNLHT
jgi:hypothetical protein